jgi:hypothetical protein
MHHMLLLMLLLPCRGDTMSDRTSGTAAIEDLDAFSRAGAQVDGGRQQQQQYQQQYCTKKQ